MTRQFQDLFTYPVAVQRPLVGVTIQPPGDEYGRREDQDEQHGCRRHGHDAAAQP